MSDNLGPNQTRVMESAYRNFESITYQKKKPPLSSEGNLAGKIIAQREQSGMKALVPSGWASVGQFYDGILENSCQSGDVLCSSALQANSFKLITKDFGAASENCVAIVNGWPILVQGTNIADESNLIILSAPPSSGTRVDFVFLEVWRKLIYPTDIIFMHGNMLYGGINPSNDLIDPSMLGIETSLRVQLQYRIRVASCNIDTYPDGFDPTSVFIQGPLSTPCSTCSPSYFSSVPGDPGLWRGGSGDPTIFPTVDGYTYAIPMFAIRRRNTTSYDLETRTNGAGVTLSQYLLGYASDRPDDFYSDWIVSEDILDMRHRIAGGQDLTAICREAFSKLLSNQNRSRMIKSTLGEDNYGVVLSATDAISPLDMPGSTRIAQGDGTRRIFSNSSATQTETVAVKSVYEKTFGTPGSPWTIGDEIQVTIPGFPSGSTITAINKVYTKQAGPFSNSNWTTAGTGTNVVTIHLTGVSGIDSYNLHVEFIVTIPAGPNGLTHLPTDFLESRVEDSTSPMAMRGHDFRVRTLPPVYASDGTHFSMLSNRGSFISEPYDFGQRMIYHTLGLGTNVLTVPRNINGYQILGIINVKVNGVSQGRPIITRTSTLYEVNFGYIGPVAGSDVEFTLYTGGKFFEGNKQGRGIVDCFEMKEIIPDDTATGSKTVFKVDATNKPIYGFSNYSTDTYCYAWVDGSMTPTFTSNKSYPIFDSTTPKTYTSITFTAPPRANAVIEVPTYLHSNIGASERYTFTYKTVPYQGLLDNSSCGRVETEGPAITTTAGSGLITNYTYSQGGIQLYTDSTIVDGSNTSWLANVKVGQIVRTNADTSREYRVCQVLSDTQLHIQAPADRSSVGFVNYTIYAKDQPYYNYHNLIDILPARSGNLDSSGISFPIATGNNDQFPVMDTRVINRIQDLTDLPPNSVWLGQADADRGRLGVNISQAPLNLGNLGLKFENLFYYTNAYKKTYQAYVFNSENTGRLYMMVVGSETDNATGACYFNQASANDVVDLFELPGRPLLCKRIV